MSAWITTTAEGLFWVSLFLACYTYFIYPLALFLVYSSVQVARDMRYISRRPDRRARAGSAPELPAVSIVIAAYNEEEILAEKLANLRALDYPKDKLDVVIVSDGSTDRTSALLGAVQEPWLRTILLETRGGKANALNCGVHAARHDILIFSDATTLFEPATPLKLVRHFTDPTVGVVCGSLQFHGSRESRATEGVYWNYESMIRLMEGRLGATLTASGAIYALRRACYPELSPETWIEDFVVPMNARKLRFKVAYDPEAIATEPAAESVEGEFKRRTRIAAGSFRALGELSRIPLDAVTLWAFFSHKVLRWILPFLMITLLLANALLCSHRFYAIALIGQLLFYLWAALGYAFRNRAHRIRFGLLGYFWLAMNVAFLVGFIRTLSGRQEVTWQRVH